MAFVSGGSGLVGTCLIYHLLQDGQTVKVLLRNEQSLASLRNALGYYSSDVDALLASLQVVYGDVRDFELLLEEVVADEDIYHCAATVSFDSRDNHLLHEINVLGTENIVNAALMKKARKLCHVSSIGALGSALDGFAVDEDTPWTTNDNSPYAISKHASEMEVWRGIAEGLNAVIVNPAVILGSGDWNRSSGEFFSRVAAGMRYTTKGSTSYVDVQDVVRAMQALMASDISGKRFVLAEGTYSYESIFKAVAHAVQRTKDFKIATPFLTGLAWRLEKLRCQLTGGKARITRYTHRSAHRLAAYSGERITRELDFAYTPIQETIARVGKQFLEK